MRCECASDMLYWFRKRPEHFFENDSYITDFLKFLNDSVSCLICVNFLYLLDNLQSEAVRITAVEICKRMIEYSAQFFGYLKPYENIIISEVVKKIDDINLDIATKAIDFCTILLNL